MTDITMVDGDSLVIRVAIFDGQNRPFKLKDKELQCIIDIGQEDFDQYEAETEDNIAVAYIPDGRIVNEGKPWFYEVIVTDNNRLKWTVAQGTITVLPKLLQR